MSQIPSIDVAGLRAAIADGTCTTLVDVRNPDEFAEGHVPEAQLLPLGELGARWEELLPARAQGPLYLICRSGARSMSAAQALAGQGFSVINVTGGTMAWVQAGYPVAH